MVLLTTTIGSFPKPDFVMIRDWVHPNVDYSLTFDSYQADLYKNRTVETSIARATYRAVKAQVEEGINIPTDGEQGREHYIFYHLRHLTGVDFSNLQSRTVRGVDEWEKRVPTILQTIQPKNQFLRYDYFLAQEFAGDHPVKITVPGPMTIADTVVDEHYGNEMELNIALAKAINTEIRDLAEAGCRYIQIDEPLFARFPDKALTYGIENLDRCFDGVPKNVNRIVHLCCGYPRELDDPNPPKADPASYSLLAEALDASSINAVSLEDAHRHFDLKLLEKFGNTSIIFGSVAIANSKVEPMEEIRERLENALGHIDADRLIVGPDCGLGMLPEETAKQKLENLVKAANSF